MKNNQLIGSLLLAASISACSAGNTPEMKPPKPQIPTQANCPVIDSSDWIAWINKMPGPDQPSLHVIGKIVLPTPGYNVEVKTGPLDRRQPPAQRLRLEITAPTGIVAQVLTTQEVKAKIPAYASAYRAIIIGCGNKVLAEITKIDTAY